MRARFQDKPFAQKGLSLVSIRLAEGARVDVRGLGVPYANGDDPELESWVVGNEPITGDVTLRHVLTKRHFLFVVDKPHHILACEFTAVGPPPFTYPYGQSHSWSTHDMWQLHLNTRAKEPYSPSYCHEDLNSLIAILAHGSAQDVLWLDRAAEEIRMNPFRCYLIPRISELADSLNPLSHFYVIIPMTKEFRESHESAWARLTKDGALKIAFCPDEKDVDPIEWYVCGASSLTTWR